MKDVVAEYIWFGVVLLGTMLGLRILFVLFYGDTSAIHNMIGSVLGGLM